MILPLAGCGRGVWMYHHRPLLIRNKGVGLKGCLLWPGPSTLPRLPLGGLVHRLRRLCVPTSAAGAANGPSTVFQPDARCAHRRLAIPQS